MGIRYLCPMCGQALESPRSLVGKQDSCPSCRATFLLTSSLTGNRSMTEQRGWLNNEQRWKAAWRICLSLATIFLSIVAVVVLATLAEGDLDELARDLPTLYALVALTTLILVTVLVLRVTMGRGRSSVKNAGGEALGEAESIVFVGGLAVSMFALAGLCFACNAFPSVMRVALAVAAPLLAIHITYVLVRSLREGTAYLKRTISTITPDMTFANGWRVHILLWAAGVSVVQAIWATANEFSEAGHGVSPTSGLSMGLFTVFSVGIVGAGFWVVFPFATEVIKRRHHFLLGSGQTITYRIHTGDEIATPASKALIVMVWGLQGTHLLWLLF